MAKMNQAMQDLLRYNAAILPQKRSVFNKSHSHTTTMDSAYLVPLMWDRVLPGDEKKIRYSGLARMSTPLVPVMDEAKLDVWAFYVPDRLWYAHAREFYGENKDASFNPDGEYQMPSLTYDQYGVNPFVVNNVNNGLGTGIGSLNDYFGFPVIDGMAEGIDGNLMPKCTAGLHRSYQLIWNEWFRNSSIQPALRLNTGDNVTDEEWNVIRQIRKVCKYPDYFTSLLKEPQAGPDVVLPLGEWAPVVTRDQKTFSGDYDYPGVGLTFGDGFGSNITYSDPFSLWANITDDGAVLVRGDEASSAPDTMPVTFDNLWADLTNTTSATINNLRAAITAQHFLEISNLAGKRYQQIIQAHFGCFIPDATLQRPELLGLCRSDIGMRQVLQTSASQEGSTPQGNTAAFSLTNVANEWICNKAFTEPGFIMVLGAIRPVQSYSQGIDPLLTKLDPWDHYWPVFDNLGNQPVPVSAIYCSQNIGLGHDLPSDPNAVFGYQEAWTEYRVRQNRVSGLMRPDIGALPDEPGYPADSYNGTLAYWNYSTNFSEAPILNTDFVTEDENLIDRSIAIHTEPQFIIDSYFDYIDAKNMSVHSIPGLTRL